MTLENTQFVPGTCLASRYEVIKNISVKVGRETLLVKDLQTQELVIVKLVKFGAGIDWNQIKLFQREAQILKTLSHPAIPKYRDYFEFNLSHLQGFALVQDYINAKSLEEQCQAGRRFIESEIKQLATAILKILIDLHAQKPAVIHRDIKPSNILVTNRSGNHVGDIYLVDFGSVQHLAESQGGTLTIVGTYGYMPPEQFGGKASAASDLYSLGATLIYVATGVHPAEIPQKDLRLQFELMVDLSSSFIQWLKRITEPSLDRRFDSAEVALKALEEPKLIAIKPRLSHKPSSSKILLSKNDHKIKLIIPKKTYSIGKKHIQKMIKPLLFLSLIKSLVIFLLLSMIFAEINYSDAIPPVEVSLELFIKYIMDVFIYLFIFTFSITLLLFILTLSVYLISYHVYLLFHRSKININLINKSIVYKTKFLGVLPFYRTLLRGKIINILQKELDLNEDHQLDINLKNGQSLSSILIVTEAHKKCWIEDLTQDEADWLSSELCYSLDLPLVKQKMQSINELNHE